MPSAFVPFLKSGGKTVAASGPPGTAALTDSAASAGAFAALMPNGASSNPAAATNCAHAPNGATAQPTVTLQKDGDRVTHIRIHCACGQVVELECAY